MKIKKLEVMETNKKELLIFLLVAFGIPFLMGIPLAIISGMGADASTFGNEPMFSSAYFIFGNAQMYYPAAGLILAKLICDKEKSLMPKNFFVGFLVLTAAMMLWCFTVFFLPEKTATSGCAILLGIGSIMLGAFYFFADDETHSTAEKLGAYGLKSKHWNLSIRLLILFLALYFFRIFIVNFYTGDMATLLSSFSPSNLLHTIWILLISFPLVFSGFLGEEYGWRCYFQPLLQQKFGLIKGVLVFGLLWAFWHLPLDLVNLTAATSITEMVQLLLIRYTHCMLLGIFMAYTYMKTHNIWVPVIIHFLHNNLAAFGAGASEQEFTWMIVGIFIIIEMVSFLPFLFSKVFRKQAEI
jgi:membrane protease YdiL (CAAX protease family)